MEDKMNDTVEKRLAALEKKYMTLYNRFYARAVRRSETFDRRTVQMSRLADNYENISQIFKRLAPVADQIRNDGRILVTLSRPQYQLLHAFLAGRKKG
jgi:hypothetical protein